jgi:starch synthase
MLILFAAPEAAPYAKTGGLADVAGSLPPALKRLGVDARLVMPFYRVVKEQNPPLRQIISSLEVPLGREKIKANVLEGSAVGGVPVYFIEREDFYDRPNLYGNSYGDYYDNLERFSFFSHAVLKLVEHLSIRPDCIHCNDWQTGLIPAIMKGPPYWFMDIRSVFTIHNLGYQGIFPVEKFYLTGLPKEHFFHPGGLEYWGNFCLLKSGIVYSDIVTTVSPTYAREIQSSEYGKGMEGLLANRRKSLHGIVNGVDDRVWNPGVDPLIPSKYSLDDMKGKRLCKKSLIDELGLEPYLLDKPLIGFISRLDVQKGMDLFVSVINDIVELDAGAVVLGVGDESIQNAIQQTSRRFPGRVKFDMRFDETLAHRIMGGADMLLIPSRYEPCGLTQMYAMKYGTVPIVRATGGLDDTVISFDPETGKGNGLKFGPADPAAFLEAITTAVSFYKNKKLWKKLVRNAMQADFSWERSARSYLKLYRSLAV